MSNAKLEQVYRQFSEDIKSLYRYAGEDLETVLPAGDSILTWYSSWLEVQVKLDEGGHPAWEVSLTGKRWNGVGDSLEEAVSDFCFRHSLPVIEALRKVSVDGALDDKPHWRSEFMKEIDALARVANGLVLWLGSDSE